VPVPAYRARPGGASACSSASDGGGGGAADAPVAVGLHFGTKMSFSGPLMTTERGGGGTGIPCRCRSAVRLLVCKRRGWWRRVLVVARLCSGLWVIVNNPKEKK